MDEYPRTVVLKLGSGPQVGSPNIFWGSQNDLAALCINILGFDMLYSLSEMVFSTSGWIMKTNIVSASSLIIQDKTEFRPIISCQNVWGVARLGKWILWVPRTKSLRTTDHRSLPSHLVSSQLCITPPLNTEQLMSTSEDWT